MREEMGMGYFNVLSRFWLEGVRKAMINPCGGPWPRFEVTFRI
jgi:hypothetical protein